MKTKSVSDEGRANGRLEWDGWKECWGCHQFIRDSDGGLDSRGRCPNCCNCKACGKPVPEYFYNYCPRCLKACRDCGKYLSTEEAGTGLCTDCGYNSQ